ncbi:MAG: sigma-70 family RNA polymerase sigma factor [Terracidiphilus sp.]|nr:sigma-70 family RNA polymerase sigma factor [Terracidiphilus sp.]
MRWEFVLPNSIAGSRPHAPALAAGLPAEMLMNSDAFAAFYQRSARPLWAYLARVSADPALADDLLQESFVRLLCAGRPELSLAEGEVAARRYLFRIASNLLRDHWRRPVSASIEELPEELFAATDRSAQADTQAVLGPALARMRPRDRQLLWLAHAEGYSHGEIAQITGLASASIRLLLFRARRKIARILMAQDELHALPNAGQPRHAPDLRSQP